MGALRPRTLQPEMRWPPFGRAPAKAPCSTSPPTRSSSRLLLRNLRRSLTVEEEDNRRLEFRPTAKLSRTNRRAAPRASVRPNKSQQHRPGRTTTMSPRSIARWSPASIRRSRSAVFLTEVAGLPTTPALLGSVELVEGDSAAPVARRARLRAATRATPGAVTAAYLDRLRRRTARCPWRRSAPRAARTRCRICATVANRPAARRVAHGAAAGARRSPEISPEPTVPRTSSSGSRNLRRVERVCERACRCSRRCETRGGRMRSPASTSCWRCATARRALDDAVAARGIDGAEHPPPWRPPSRTDAGSSRTISSSSTSRASPPQPLARAPPQGAAARDIAGLIRSIDYSATAALERALEGRCPTSSGKLGAALGEWRERAARRSAAPIARP